MISAFFRPRVNLKAFVSTFLNKIRTSTGLPCTVGSVPSSRRITPNGDLGSWKRQSKTDSARHKRQQARAPASQCLNAPQYGQDIPRGQRAWTHSRSPPGKVLCNDGGRHKYDRNVLCFRGGFYAAAHLEAIHVVHSNVEDDQVGAMAFQKITVPQHRLSPR